MLIDCDTCAAPASACGGCVMTVLLRGRAGARAGHSRSGPEPGAPDEHWSEHGVGRGVELDDDERVAIGALVHAGLVPPLRLVRGVTATGAGRAADPVDSWGPTDPAQGIA